MWGGIDGNFGTRGDGESYSGGGGGGKGLSASGSIFSQLINMWQSDGYAQTGSYWVSKNQFQYANEANVVVFGNIKNGQWHTNRVDWGGGGNNHNRNQGVAEWGSLMQNGDDEGESISRSSSNFSNLGSIGTGFQINVGMGMGQHGTQLTAGAFGSGLVRQLFFSVTEPDKNNNDFSFDFSASAQIMAGYAKSGNFDISGKGRNYGYGFDPFSFSYSADKDISPAYRIVGIGPSLGVKYSGSTGNSQTYAVPYISWSLFGGMIFR